MRALVLGGAGFLGRHVVARLHAVGWRVRVLDRSFVRSAATLPRGVQRITAELHDEPALRAALAGVDVIFHLAGSTDLGASEEIVDASKPARCVTAATLARAAARAEASRIIYFSSGGTVYGRAQALPISESWPVRPLSAHGRLCLASEAALAEGDVDVVVLRVANAYGPGQRTDRRQGLVAMAFARMCASAPVDVFGSGTAVRDFVHVEDVADAAMRAVCYGGRERVFNVGTGVATSVNEVLEMVAKHLAVTLRVRHLPPRPFDVEENVLDVSRAKHELGWTPRVPLEDGIAALGRASRRVS